MIKSLVPPLILCLLLFCLVSVAQEREIEHIHVVNNDIPPLLFKQRGQYQGPYYEKLRKLLAEAKLQYELDILPWPRVYQTLLTQPNTMIVSIGRTPKRESLFHWIGPVVNEEEEMFFYQLKDEHIEVDKISPSGPYSIAVLRDTYFHEYLQVEGYPPKNYYAVLGGDELLQMLLKKRVDLILLSDQNLALHANNLGVDIGLFKKSNAAFTIAHYMALSKGSSPELVERLQDAYQRLAQKSIF
ncbi:transporter substrate-binding domain-containing protein [Aliiglaciecola sp. CAU 1673]|uniref:substrate-binding periplasmic protein n=1 Tax=Aliiglaciecola sp. CAU 1673 TaxID=3032595 RepID=UPI0023DC487D|nr:transporter substrate-binding domain-containing protein [Aliiglaciecola sp. CAU 1673]MDF2180082.1 transporter substrate-binding domain-containing protein [Aliiglaciecola sp. CAU 1673]